MLSTNLECKAVDNNNNTDSNTDSNTNNTNKRKLQKEDECVSTTTAAADTATQDAEKVAKLKEGEHFFRELPAGVDCEVAFVNERATVVNVAVKAKVPCHRHSQIYNDIIFLYDATRSMRSMGLASPTPASHGMKVVNKNMQRLLEAELSKINSSDRDIVKSTTSFAFAQFGAFTRWFEDTNANTNSEPKTINDRFLSTDNVTEHCDFIATQMEFVDGYTDIGSALVFAANALRDRFMANVETDDASNIRRIGSIVLLTDGIHNYGDTANASRMRMNVDRILSDVACTSGHVGVYGIGLGESTDSHFMRTLVNGRGSWAHITDGEDPTDAFERTIGSLLRVRGTFDVRFQVVATAHEDSKDAVVVQSETTVNFGFLTDSIPSAKTVALPLPRRTALGVPYVYNITASIDNGFQTFTTEVGTMDDSGAPLSRSPTVPNAGMYEETVGSQRIMNELEFDVSEACTPAEQRNAFDRFSKCCDSNPVALRRINAARHIMEETTSMSSRATMSYIAPYASPGLYSEPRRSVSDRASSASFSQAS